jgi:hypothetical protein
LSGCRAYDVEITGLGYLLFWCFLIYWAAAELMPRLQNLKAVKRALDRGRKPLIAIAQLMMVIGVVSASYGYFAEGVHRLFVCVGGVIIVGAHYLKRWGQSKRSSNPIELKMVFCAASILLALLWLIFFANDYLRF